MNYMKLAIPQQLARVHQGGFLCLCLAGSVPTELVRRQASVSRFTVCLANYLGIRCAKHLLTPGLVSPSSHNALGVPV